MCECKPQEISKMVIDAIKCRNATELSTDARLASFDYSPTNVANKTIEIYKEIISNKQIQ